MMTTQLQLQKTDSDFMTRLLQADGLFCATTGGICLAAARPLATLFGLNLPAIFTVVGGLVLVYGLSLWLLAGRAAHTRFWVQVALALNVVWVVASFGGLLAGLFPVTTAGKWVIAILADLVLIIALLQLYGLRRSQ
jgi:hypothetical protein